MNLTSALPAVKPGIPRSRQPFDLNREILASDLNQSAKVLLLVVVDHAGHGRSKCTASTGTLARESGMTDRHVRNLLPVLESAGWIQVERATGSRQSRHTIYLAPRDGSKPFLKVHAVGNPELHEVGNPELHEVGNPGACSRKFPVHAVGTPVPTNGSSTAPENVSRCAPIAQNFNPPAPREPEAIPRGADLAECVEIARGLGHPAKLMRELLARLEREGKLSRVDRASTESPGC